MRPFFSIIIPAYNREEQIARALRSCMAQDHASFEVVVVDDGSTDHTASVVEGCSDRRIRLVRREVNGGPCQARNTGIAIAQGQWFVILDSDFTLKPSALGRLQAWCATVPAEVGNCISACEWDNGWLTPRPFPPPLMAYVDYLQWMERVEISEYFNCIRAEVFADISYAKSRAWETSFHLALARRWQLAFQPESVVVVHTDAGNRLTTAKGPSALQRLLQDSADKADDADTIEREHGEALRAHSPRCWAVVLREQVKQNLLAGRRRRAARLVSRHVGSLNVDLRFVVIMTAGLLHRRLLAWLNSRS